MKIFGTEEYFDKYEFTKPYQLASSDCESVTLAELIQAGGGSLEEFSQIRLGYTEMRGSELLRKEISKRYETVTAHNVLVLGSPIEGIYLTMRAVLKAGDRVVVLSPAYDALFNVAEHISQNAVRWFLKNNGNSWSLDFDQLEKLLSQKTKLLVINFPHNPTGFVPTETDLKKMIEIAKRYNVQVFSDEIYRGLEYGVACSKSVADLDSNSIILSGASKSFGLPGLRFGWLVVKDSELYKELLNLKSYTSMCSPQTSEYLGLMAIKGAESLIRRNLSIVKNNLSLAESFFKEWQKHLQWLRPLGGSVSVVKIDQPSAEQFCHEIAASSGVVLLPLQFMGYEDKYFRMGFGRTNFKANLDIFQSALNKMYRS